MVGITPVERKAKPWWMIDNKVLDKLPTGKRILLGYYAANHKEINKVIPGDVRAVPVKQIAEAQMGTLEKIEGFTQIVYIVVLCLSAFLLMNYMFSAVSEQRREIGIVLAMGMNAARIYKIFIFKALILGIIGGSAGYAIGTLISVILGPQIADARISPLLHILPYSLLLSTAICIISSILPARRATKLDVVEALREV